MAYIQDVFPIVQKKNLAKNIFDMTISCPHIAAEAVPGQFVHVKAPGFQLRRPISICGIDKAKGTIRIVFEIRGEGTEKIAGLNPGDLIDVFGPLGHGYTILPPESKVVVIGGGIGVPPLLQTAAAYGKNATAIIGFRNAAVVILKEDFEKNGARVILCTDDGTAGVHGFVTTALEKLLAEEKPDLICACGPMPMLKGVAAMAEEKGIACEISLEERMACGVGACLGCACKTVKNGVEGYSHVCKDGPVFNSKEVRF